MFFLLTLSAGTFAQIGVSITIAPPALPVYEQPPCPDDGYLWTPGYWAWGDDGYFWVPGTWVLAPQPGFLWTPGYWGWGGAAFIWHEGYWGPTVGYFGNGFEGGRWDHDHFYYNRSVTNVNVTNIHNVYNTTVINNTTTVNRISYNGGTGGINARPTAAEEAAANGRHVPPVAAQTQHVQEARGNPELRASANQGKPPIAATQKPGEFKGDGAVAAREAGAPYRAPEKPAQGQPAGGARPENNRPENSNDEAAKPANAAPKLAVHPSDLPAYERPAAPNTGNPKLDQKYQQQQQKLQAQQEKQRQQLQQQQDKEHAQLAKQNADDARKQQVEQRHQQQTQQLQQRQTAAQQKMVQRQAPPPAAHPEPERR
jgi:WXXGXW repeat (2 copies)